MERGILITLPKHDDVTEYLSEFSKEIIDEANSNSIKVKRIDHQGVTKDNFTKALNNLDYHMIILNGHGSPSSITGHKNQEIITLGENHDLLKERITYARSCHAGSELGHGCMKENVNGCFIGYSIPFMFFIDTNRAATPWKDKVAKLFLDPSNLVPLSIIRGNSAAEAHDKSRKQMLKNINKMILSKDPDSQAMASAMWNNCMGQILIGNSEVRLM